MRLLIATPEYPPHDSGGIARFYGVLAPALARLGCEVTVLVASPYSDDFESYEHAGVRVRSVPRRAIDERSADMAHLAAAPLFRRAIAAARASADAAADLGTFDVVETTDFALQFVPFVLGRSAASIVVQCHGSMGQISLHEPRQPERDLDHALARLTEASLLGAAHDLQTLGPANAAEWSARLHRPVRVLAPALPPAEEAWEGGDCAVVVGRIQPWKGPEVLCRALRRLPSSILARVVWVGGDTPTAPGGGSYDAWLRREYPDIWGVRVEVVGPRPYAESMALRRRSRLVIVPSAWDVFNFTAAEAMSAGCVVVCSDAAGAAHLITPGESGYTFRSGDADDLARAIALACALDGPAAAMLSARARAMAAETLDPDRVARERADVFRGLSGGSVAPPHVPDWLRDFFDGHDSARASLDFLEQVSIRDLAGHLGDRLRRRVTGRVARGGA